MIEIQKHNLIYIFPKDGKILYDLNFFLNHHYYFLIFINRGKNLLFYIATNK